MFAAELGDYRTVETLLRNGADPKAEDKVLNPHQK
jgi:hypothetical protein